MTRETILKPHDQTQFELLQTVVAAGELHSLTHEDKIKYYAMRTVRDFIDTQSLTNAIVWVERAFKDGMDHGTYITATDYRKHILKAFGLKDRPCV